MNNIDIKLNKINDILNNVYKINDNNVKIIKRILGGMSSETYLISKNDIKLIVHISDDNCLKFVDRKDEYYSLKQIQDLSLIQKPVYLSLKDKHIRIFEYIEGTPLNEIDDINYEIIASSLKEFHNSKLLKNNYNPLSKIKKLLRKTKELPDKLFYEGHEILKSCEKVLKNRKLYPCHNDLRKENLIYSNNNIYLIDFEFAGNNDYLFDIASFGNDDINDSLKLLKAYNPNHSKKDIVNLYLWRIYISLQWYLIALQKHELGFDSIYNLNFKDIGLTFLNKNIPLYRYINENKELLYV